MPPLSHAFDELRFGPDRILDLHELLPSGQQAVARAEAWLREKQAGGAKEVLVITGRGRNSEGGVPVVREEVRRLLARLRRGGVVKDAVQHTEGSFAVMLAPLSALRDAPRRRRDPAPPRARDPESLLELEPRTRELLRKVALRALEELGIRDPEPFVQREMLDQLSCAVRSLPDCADREERLRAALAMLLAEYDDR
ncbi:MAG TPA: Smr/MutS family protein [Gemmatimonadaceae bacterium]|nr:Smr/MutS family protein [Gemmatimonadaceae bacterium]